MSNTPNFKRARTLAEYADERRVQGGITIPMSDGNPPIEVPPREFYTRATNDLLLSQLSERVQMAQRGFVADDHATDEACARSVIGDSAFDRFAAEVESVAGPDQDAGAFFWRYVQAERERQQGVTEGE